MSDGAEVTHAKPDLEQQLLDMRAALLRRLAERVTGGDLAVLGSVGAALAAIRDMRRHSI